MKSGKKDGLVVYFDEEKHDDYDNMWATTKMEFDGNEFWMDYKINNGYVHKNPIIGSHIWFIHSLIDFFSIIFRPEKCSDWDPCYFAIVDEKCDKAKIDEYFEDVDYESIFSFTSTEYGDAAGRMWEIDIDENENDIEGKHMVLVGHNDKFSRRVLKKSDKNEDGLEILACGKIEKY